MQIDSHSEIKEFTGDSAVGAITEANLWMIDNKVIATNLTLYSTTPDANNNFSVTWYVVIIYNVKESLNAAEEAARSRMPNDIPYKSKDTNKENRHH